MSFRTRFAPSPTGPLHLGHAYSACLAHDTAQAENGTFVLRIEDIDQSRARAQWTQAIFDDLHWLGLSWDTPVLAQSTRMQTYRQHLNALWTRGLAYICTCNRRDILQAISAPQEGVPTGPDGVVYPGTCRANSIQSGMELRHDSVLRLDMGAALAQITAPLRFEETGQGPDGQSGTLDITPDAALRDLGDIVLARRDMGTSYHLSVVLDDAFQGITDVVRGQDLFEATYIHVILQHVLDLPVPRYHHHRLIRDAAGRRLAKRDDARAIATYRAQGDSPQDLRARIELSV